MNDTIKATPNGDFQVEREATKDTVFTKRSLYGLPFPTGLVEYDTWPSRIKCEAPTGVPVHLPTDAKERKATPIFSGVMAYFPKALAEIARVSKAGNDQHNPGQPLHWDKAKSLDHADCIARHLIDCGTRDADGMLHSAKVAWRALALLETELETKT